MSFSSKELPLVTSLGNTIEAWPKMQSSEKTAAVLANLTSAARPAARLIHEFHRKGQPTRVDIAASLAVILTDKLDGKIAKSYGGMTDFGKEFDPLMDKFDFFIWERAQYERGELALPHLITRLSRDIAVTLVRSYVKGSTNGAVDVSADRPGQASTALRGASLLATDTRIERYIPRSVHQNLATAAITATGVTNIITYFDKKNAYDLAA